MPCSTSSLSSLAASPASPSPRRSSDALGSPEVNYVATQPGTPGPLVAFAAELAISFVLMLTVLTVSNTARLRALHCPILSAC